MHIYLSEPYPLGPRETASESEAESAGHWGPGELAGRAVWIGQDPRTLLHR